MTERSSSKEQLTSSLASYLSLLRERRDTLSCLSRTSAEMRMMLQRDGHSDLDPILERRERECRRLGELCEGAAFDDAALTEAARGAAAAANDDLRNLAQTVLALQADTQSLARELIACQGQCESVLKDRIQATRGALKQSSQRRKLDAAYGPAVKHDTPAFLDKQQ